MRITGSENMPAKVDVSFISGKIASSKDGKSFYLIGDSDHIYLYATDKELNNSLEEIFNQKIVNEMIDGFKNNKKVCELCKHCSFLGGKYESIRLEQRD